MRSRLATVLLPLALLAGALAGCSDDGAAGGRTTANGDVSPLAFSGCDVVACEGTLSTGAYRIQLPKTWNGTLLLWSHGYRTAVAAPPDFAAPNTAAESSPAPEVAARLLDQGYALAGSAYARNGWAVQDGVAAGEQLHDLFVQKVGTPRRTYVWGASLGGLISQLLSEKHPEWVSGAAPECGAVAGTTENLDGALAIGYLVQTLIDPTLKITGFTSPEEALASFAQASRAVIAAAQDASGGGTAEVELIAAIGHLASQTKTYDGHDFPSTVGAHAESIITALGFTTFGQQEFATRVGGQALDITGLDFSAPVDEASVRPLVEGLGGDLDALLQQVADGPRPAVDAAAREKARALGETTGKVDHPTVTLHTEQDPLVPVYNERVLGDRIAEAAGGVSGLVQLYTKAPATYAAPAPYGAGHCTFTLQEELGLVQVLDGFVRTGVRPTTADTTAAFAGGPSGLDTSYGAPPFPLLRR